jgi:hypothetical protein
VTRHGWLLDVVGAARCFEGIWFAPVCGEVDDPEEMPTHWLQDHAQVQFPCEGFELGDSDGIWVRAALTGVFGYSPLRVSDGRSFLLDAAFAAVLAEGQASWVAYPFACTDLCGRTGLVFSRQGPGTEVRDRVAQAFWGLLLAECTNTLSEFSAPGVAFDTGDGYDTELILGYSRGEFYAEDMRDNENDVFGKYDPHVVWLAGEMQVCPECGGSGEESFFPGGELCELCGGTGKVPYALGNGRE